MRLAIFIHSLNRFAIEIVIISFQLRLDALLGTLGERKGAVMRFDGGFYGCSGFIVPSVEWIFMFCGFMVVFYQDEALVAVKKQR